MSVSGVGNVCFCRDGVGRLWSGNDFDVFIRFLFASREEQTKKEECENPGQHSLKIKRTRAVHNAKEAANKAGRRFGSKLNKANPDSRCESPEYITAYFTTIISTVPGNSLAS